MTVNGIPIQAFTPIGLLCFVLAFPYLQMARGKLVPRSTLQDAIYANRSKDATIKEQSDQLNRLLREFGPVFLQLLEEIRDRAEETEPGDTRRTDLGDTTRRPL